MDRSLIVVGLEPVWQRPISLETMAVENYSNVDYIAAVEVNIRDLLAARETGPVADGLKRIEATWRKPGGFPPTRLTESSLALMHAWLLRVDRPADAVEAARRAADWARREEAPWWVARAIRALPDGTAADAELAEADEIEQRLKVVPGAAAPPI